MTNPSTPYVVHELPRRFRIRYPILGHRHTDSLYLQALLENIAGVDSVRINRCATSIIVTHDGSATIQTDTLATLKTLPEAAFSGYEQDLSVPINPLMLTGLSILTFSLRVLPPSIQGAVSFFVALPTLLKGADTLLNRGLKIDVLDAGAVGFSLLRRDYFTSNMVILLLGLGEYLEQISEDKTTGLLKSLLRPQVDEVWVEKDGVEIQTPISQLYPGDLIICGPGEMIPIDGIVARGEALVNQSSITGESVPLHKKPGDEILSGAVVEEGKIAIRVDTVGNDTGLARINRFLENSLRSSSPAQKKSEELADRLVPLTFGLGLLVFLLTRDIRRAAAVLTVDYSCAIKLATPIAVKTAMYSAAHQGVLIKGANALDQLAQVDTLIFDKTGTLTCGDLQVTDVKPISRRMAQKTLLALAASAEEHYDHPVARAVVNAAREKNLQLPPISQVDFIVAHGVSAYVDGKQILVGSRHFIEEDEQINCAAADQFTEQFYQQGKTLLYVAKEGKLAGIIAMRDDIRPEAAEVLKRFKEGPIKNIVVLTGDHKKTALALQEQLPEIDQIHWELKPEDKAGIIRELQQCGYRTAFIGDGVNDAPALVTADVGFCMPAGTDLTKNAAEGILLREDLGVLVEAIDIAERNRQTIVHSFYSTVGFNSLFLLLASMGKIQPVTAALLHNLNTVGILGYSAARGLSKRSNNDSTIPAAGAQ